MKMNKPIAMRTFVASAVFPVPVGALTTEVGGVTYRVLAPVAATAQNTYVSDDRAISAEEVAKLKDRSWRAMNVFDPASELSIASGATLDLGDVDQTVATLTLAGRLQKKDAATWGAIGSGAKYETPMITGSGILRVKGPGRGLVLIVK